MSKVRCHRCGRLLPEGSLKYEVAISIRSTFDGTIPEEMHETGTAGLARIVREAAARSEEELNREIYEDDAFVMCPECKEALLQEIYSHLHPQATPEHGRAHLVH
jgi:phage FluMu protein Com